MAAVACGSTGLLSLVKAHSRPYMTAVAMSDSPTKLSAAFALEALVLRYSISATLRELLGSTIWPAVAIPCQCSELRLHRAFDGWLSASLRRSTQMWGFSRISVAANSPMADKTPEFQWRYWLRT